MIFFNLKEIQILLKKGKYCLENSKSMLVYLVYIFLSKDNDSSI